jgi:cobalt/nickel transport system permease protein
MHYDFIDRYSRIDSPVHSLSSGLKVTISLILILIVVLSPVKYVYLFVTVVILLLTIILISKIPLTFFLKKLLLFEPFILTIAILTLLQPNGVVIFTSILVKSTLSLVTVVLLSNTTPFSELLNVLRKAHVAPLFITLLALMYRYLFILIDEIEHMKVARTSRTFTKKSSRKWSFLTLILGQLFIRTTERAERIYSAMCARGWK